VSTIDPATLERRFPQITRSEAPEAIAQLARALAVHEAAAGETLVAASTVSDELFLVVDGTLDISLASPGGERGERKLASVAPGQMFGEMSLLDPGPAGANVITEEGATVLRIARPRLDQLRRERPEAAAPLLREVIRSLAARLEAAGSFASALERP
jgi:CRP-like cAMP-binding protein